MELGLRIKFQQILANMWFKISCGSNLSIFPYKYVVQDKCGLWMKTEVWGKVSKLFRTVVGV